MGKVDVCARFVFQEKREGKQAYMRCNFLIVAGEMIQFTPCTPSFLFFLQLCNVALPHPHMKCK